MMVALSPNKFSEGNGLLTASVDELHAVITLSIVVPAYNEEKNIREAIAAILASASAVVTDYEVIVIDDGSSDGTPGILREMAGQNAKIRPVFHGTNQGKGAALQSGFKQAKMAWILFTDADLQMDIKELPGFLAQTARYDLIFGFRKIRGDSMSRRLFSRGYALLIRMLLGIRLQDVNCPFKILRRSFVDSIHLRSRGFFIDTELAFLALTRGCHVKELGVTGYSRRHGVSSVKFRHVFETFGELITLVERSRKGSGTVQ